MAGLQREIAQSDSALIEFAIALSESMEVVDGATEYSLASGYAGYSLMFTHLGRCLAFHERRNSGVEKSFEMAEKHLKTAAAAWEATILRPVGLFEGVSGYIFALGAFEEARFGATPIATRMSSKLARLFKR